MAGINGFEVMSNSFLGGAGHHAGVTNGNNCAFAIS
jgi:hypothetical protein